MLNRVVITGLGVITAGADNVPQFWENLVNGRSFIDTISRFDASAFPTRFAAEIKNYDPTLYLDRNDIKRNDLFTQYALIAAKQAIAASGIDIDTMNPFDAGVIWGSGQGGMETFEQEVTAFNQGDGRPRFSPFFIPRLIANMASGMISIRHGFMGINYTTVSACATSNTAIMDAFNYIRWGKAKVMVTGGSEAPITPASFGGFSSMKAMSRRNDSPATASRPFDAERDGFVMGEGAGALVLEEREHAMRRGATILGEISGAAMTADAYHMTATHPEGKGAAEAMRLALAEAQLSIDDLDYLNPHATSTPVGDVSESLALASLLGPGNNRLLVSATKSMTGHLLGAAGAIEAIICTLALQHNTIPPTINTINTSDDIPRQLNLVKTEARETKLLSAMSNTFGFGGHNATVVFRKN